MGISGEGEGSVAFAGVLPDGRAHGKAAEAFRFASTESGRLN